MKLIEKIKSVFYSNFVAMNFPFIPQLSSRYSFILDDIKSLFNYYFLIKRGEFDISSFRLGIFSTTFCNANCVFCGSQYFKDKRATMPFNIFKKAVDEYISLGGKSVGLTPSPGEVLLDPDFFKKLAYLNKNKLETGLYTNAILFDKYAEELTKNKVDNLFIDLGDVVPEKDAEIFRIPVETSKKRIKGILNFLEVIDKRGIKMNLEISFRPQRSPKRIFNDMKKTKFWEYFKKGLFRIAFLQCYDNWCGLISKKNLLGIQKLKISPKIKKYPCSSLSSIAVLPNGDIRLCGCRYFNTLQDELVIGNIENNSLKEIINSDKCKKIIAGFKHGKIPFACKKCSFYRPEIN